MLDDCNFDGSIADLLFNMCYTGLTLGGIMRFLKSGLLLATLAVSTNALAQSIAEMGEQAKEMVAEIKSINQKSILW